LIPAPEGILQVPATREWVVGQILPCSHWGPMISVRLASLHELALANQIALAVHAADMLVLVEPLDGDQLPLLAPGLLLVGARTGGVALFDLDRLSFRILGVATESEREIAASDARAVVLGLEQLARRQEQGRQPAEGAAAGSAWATGLWREAEESSSEEGTVWVDPGAEPCSCASSSFGP
jgi:hypothetical protein